jgi:hypothetical protein
MVGEPAKTMREAWTAAGLEASLPIVALTYFSLGEGAAELSRVRRVRNREHRGHSEEDTPHDYTAGGGRGTSGRHRGKRGTTAHVNGHILDATGAILDPRPRRLV